MAESGEERKNFFSLFPNFGFKLPFPKNESKQGESPSKVKSDHAGEADESTTEKPDVVWFPVKPLEVAPQLKLEVEEESGKTSNPLILWQVYALGGFLILRWVWGRWKERKGTTKREPDGDEGSDGDGDGYHSPDDDTSFH